MDTQNVSAPKKRGRRPRTAPATAPKAAPMPHDPLLDMLPSKEEILKAQADVQAYDLEAPQVAVDPWRHKDPTRILEHPPGFRLRWCNAKHRYKRGWEGWAPIRRDEELGVAIEKGMFIPQAPPRLTGYNEQDHFFRLGADLVLCKLPVGIWNARKNNLDRKNQAAAAAAKMRENRELAPGVETIGDGLTADLPPRRPLRGFAPEREAKKQESPTIGLTNLHRTK